jgi:hypothetical protein
MTGAVARPTKRAPVATRPRRPAPGAAPTSVDKERATDRRPAGTLVIFNRPIVTFRSTFFGIPPAERADTALKRISALLERGGDGNVSVEDAPQGKIVKIDGSLAFVLTPGDVDPLREQTLESLTRDTVRALEQAIGETHEARSGRLMLAAALWAFGATIVYLFCSGSAGSVVL